MHIIHCYNWTIESSRNADVAQDEIEFDIPAIDHTFQLTEDKTEGRKTHKQAAIEGGCYEGQAKHLWGNSEFGDVHVL